MLSGLPCQRFSFHGYLDKNPARRKKQIVQLQKTSKIETATQIFIEAPYRNDHTLADLIATLDDNTILCVAWDLTSDSQGVISQPIGQWKEGELPSLKKHAAIFLFVDGAAMCIH